MELGRLLDQSLDLERRAERVYRRFAASCDAPELQALWRTMAAEEAEHASAVERSINRLPATRSWHTRVDGCDEALSAAQTQMAKAERVCANPDLQLTAALHLELSEIDALRRLALAAADWPIEAHDDPAHVAQLADAAVRLSTDEHVQMLAMLLRARIALGPPRHG